jgi:hypothetical protein
MGWRASASSCTKPDAGRRDRRVPAASSLPRPPPTLSAIRPRLPLIAVGIISASIHSAKDTSPEKHSEDLYVDSARLISLLEQVVERTAYNPKETAGIYAFYAKFFWEAVTDERNEGHPRRRTAEQLHG